MRNLFKILLTVIALFFLNKSYSQNNSETEVIELDFLKSEKIGDKLNEVKYGKKYILKINNINRSLYKISSTITQEDNNIKLPEIFKGIKLPSYLSLALPDSPDVGSVKDGLAALPSNENEDSYKSEVDNIKNSYIEFQKLANLNNEFKNLYASCSMPYIEINNELIKLAQGFTGDNSNNEKKYQEDKLKQKINTLINTVINSSQKIEELLPKTITAINKKIIEKKYRIYEWDAIQMPKTDPDYKNGYITYKLLNDDVSKSKSYIESLKSLKTEANKLVAELRKYRDDNNIQTLLDNYNLINKSNFTYVSNPIKVKSDEVKFDLKITSENRLKCDKDNEVVILKTLKTKGGWKVDFSTGIFFNGGNDDFLGRELQYKAINDSISTIQSKDGGDRMLLSVGALMHIYYRNGGKINWALSPGLSTTSELDGLNFHLGASAIFGRKNRLVITSGVTMREVKILDKNYDFDVEYNKSELPESPPTIKVFPKFGWFLSLTYNFSKFNSN